MARNNNTLGWKLSIARNTKYSDTVQMKNLDFYLQLDPPPTSATSGLVLAKIDDGVEGLFELNKWEICNYFEGFIRGLRKKFMKKDYVDIYEILCQTKNYDLNDEYGLYKMKTFKNKCSNLFTSFNRKLQEKHAAYQKAKTLNKHWKHPPYIKSGRDVESLNCKKVCIHWRSCDKFIFICFVNNTYTFSCAQPISYHPRPYAFNQYHTILVLMRSTNSIGYW